VMVKIKLFSSYINHVIC